MKKYNLKMLFLLFGFIAIGNINIYAQNHEHTDKCYYGTKHICDGNETTQGTCYGNPIYTYHKHLGVENQSESNGCYTKPVYTYHEHKAECYKGTTNNCSHTITFGTADSLRVPSLYSCPQCKEIAFEGFVEKVNCEFEKDLTIYAGKCSKCNYQGNSSWINNVIDDGQPYSAKLIHNYAKNELVCGKTLETIESTIYELNCGKTLETIESIKYQKICNKENGAYYDINGFKVTPQCSNTVVSIIPKNKVQTTNVPDFTIIVTYLDGKMEEKQPNRADWVSNKIYKQENVVLYYTCKNSVDGKVNTLTTTINLTTPVKVENTPIPTITPLPNNKVTPLPTIELTNPPKVTQTPIKNPTNNIKNENPIVTSIPKFENVEITNKDKDKAKDEQVENNKNENTGSLINNFDFETRKENKDGHDVTIQTNKAMCIFLIILAIFFIFTGLFVLIYFKAKNKMEKRKEKKEEDRLYAYGKTFDDEVDELPEENNIQQEKQSLYAAIPDDIDIDEEIKMEENKNED